MLRAFAGVLGILALLAAAVVGTLASVLPVGTDTPAELPGGFETVLPEEALQIQRPPASVGETVRAGDVSWSVTDARLQRELRKYTYPRTTEHGHFVVVSFTVENVSEEPVTLTEDAVFLLDDERRKYPARAYLNSPYVPPEKDVLFTEHGLLEPGEKKEGRVNFAIEPGASGFLLRLGDTDPRFVEL